ncbi:uncharacterized protein BDR25DRAFT_307854 [Lindgomyces ingoldianus]|uniref:Uncharacterized protein n=1 Tax=Lindgomyces ingoldianus TaxID=673940 RepID=A0ACB6Q8P0_9PLEO|nr:uncharacterized protein BDR25DRAFT_307854 [Lindgomyces ingoldianus]KAF2463247.1 hypothetical protein BDR25DRAFT_307854 [Lindgomyces ingoldianus]
MSFFSTTATLHHTTPLPSGTTFASALAHLQNHDLLIRLDPELAHYETLDSDPSTPNTKRYKVTDHMHTLPKGLWDTTVTFESLITNTDEGVEWVIKAPLGLVQSTRWRIVRAGEEEEEGKGRVVNGGQDEDMVEKEEKEDWCLVEDVEIKASRLLVGTVRGKCEENWRGIHGRFVGHLVGGEVKA